MKKLQKFLRFAKKPMIASAVVLSILLLFVILTGQNHGQPQNPMEKKDADASRMYRASSVLAMDDSLLDGIENANISSGGEEQSHEKEQEEKEEQEEENQEQHETNQEETERQDSAEISQTDEPDRTDLNPDSAGDGQGVSDSLMSLIQNNNKNNNNDKNPSENPPSGDGGNPPGPGENNKPVTGGEDMTLNPEESRDLFTTSIIDGEQVSKPDYYFTITLTEKGKAQKLISQTVAVNGSSKSFENGDSVKLREGANLIQVTLRFRDKNYNQVDAPTKVYTVYYIPDNHYYLKVMELNAGIELTDGQSVDLVQPMTHLEIIAKSGNGKENLVVRINGQRISSQEDGTYLESLILGDNKLIVTVGSGVNQQKITCNLKYSPEQFTLGFESEAISEEIRGDAFGGSSYGIYSSEFQKFDFRVRCSGGDGDETITSVKVTTRFGTTEMADRISGRDGYISLDELDASDYTNIQVTCSNGKFYTWKIKYERTGQTPAAKRPIIEMNLADGEELDNSPYILTVHAKDYQQNPLYPGQMEVFINGTEVSYSGISGISYEYIMYLKEGKNNLQVKVTDNEQYTAAKEITFYYSAQVKNVRVTLIVDAGVLGLNPWISETLDVPSTTTVAQYLEERLAAYNFQSSYSGTPVNGDYYLRSIAKPNMISGWNIPEERMQYYAERGYYIDQDQNLDSLGEFDFTPDSGWMITLNNYFIGMGMGTRPVRNEDVIHVQFTLDRGGDINVNPDGGIYG